MTDLAFNELLLIEKAAPHLGKVEADLRARQKDGQAAALCELQKDITATIDRLEDDSGPEKSFKVVTRSRVADILQQVYAFAQTEGKYKMLPLFEELNLCPKDFIKAERFNRFLDGDSITAADLENKETISKTAVKYLETAWRNMSALHRASPEHTADRMRDLHGFTFFALQSDPDLAAFTGQVLKNWFAAESDERLLECMGGSIQTLAKSFPVMAPMLAETIAQKAVGMKISPHDIHTMQLLSEVCGLTKRPELFVAACLHKTCTGAGAVFSAGGQYFETHLAQCSDEYKHLAGKVLALHEESQAGKPGDYQKQYSALLPSLGKTEGKKSEHCKKPKPC